MANLSMERQGLNPAANMRRCFLARRPGRRGTAGWSRQRKPFALGLLLLAWFIAAPRAQAQGSSLSEYQLKAAFLLNFAKFVDWPPGSFAGPESPFLICVVGEDPFGRVLDDDLLGKTIGDHPVQIERFTDLKYVSHARDCQIVFLSTSIRRHFREVMDNFRGASALVVADTPGFALSGGTIEFTLEENHVRFTINTDAAERAGLRLSSKLLSLAKIVHDGAGGRS